MTVQTLYSAATGMTAMETKLDVIANNLANIETTAFKRGRTDFEDLFYRHEKMPGIQDSAGQYTRPESRSVWEPGSPPFRPIFGREPSSRPVANWMWPSKAEASFSSRTLPRGDCLHAVRHVFAQCQR